MEVTGSIVVVEDEPLISMLIEDMAAEIGWQVEASANSEAAALEVLAHQTPTVAVLDINLGSAVIEVSP